MEDRKKSFIEKPVEEFKKIHWGDVIAIVVIICSIGGYFLNRIDNQFNKLDSTLERIERDNREFHGRFSNLEGKFDERGIKKTT